MDSTVIGNYKVLNINTSHILLERAMSKLSDYNKKMALTHKTHQIMIPMSAHMHIIQITYLRSKNTHIHTWCYTHIMAKLTYKTKSMNNTYKNTKHLITAYIHYIRHFHVAKWHSCFLTTLILLPVELIDLCHCILALPHYAYCISVLS